jgi:hypothetical protein
VATVEPFGDNAPAPRHAGSGGPDQLVLTDDTPPPLQPTAATLRSMIGVSSGNPSFPTSFLMSSGNFVLILAHRPGGQRRKVARGGPWLAVRASSRCDSAVS